MNENEFDFANEFDEENQSPEFKAFLDNFSDAIDKELKRDKTLVINPIVMQKVSIAMNLIRKINWGDEAKTRFTNDCSDFTHSIGIQIISFGNDFVKNEKDVFEKLIKMSDEISISCAYNPGEMSIEFIFKNYFIEAKI